MLATIAALALCMAVTQEASAANGQAHGRYADPRPLNGADCLNGNGHNGCPDNDNDGDGLTNGQEAALGTNPNNPDTDMATARPTARRLRPAPTR